MVTAETLHRCPLFLGPSVRLLRQAVDLLDIGDRVGFLVVDLRSVSSPLSFRRCAGLAFAWITTDPFALFLTWALQFGPLLNVIKMGATKSWASFEWVDCQDQLPAAQPDLRRRGRRRAGMGLRLHLYLSERTERLAVRKDGIASDDPRSAIHVVISGPSRGEHFRIAEISCYVRPSLQSAC